MSDNTTPSQPESTQATQQQFANTQDLPPSTPQGQQITREQLSNPNSTQGSTGFDKSAIYNPHTEATDGNEDTHFGYKIVQKIRKTRKSCRSFYISCQKI